MTAEWDARTYDRIADPMHSWGLEVLERLPLAGDERVLDAGCGSGRVTEALAERLPNGHVVALDASPAMLVEARHRLARFGERVTFVEADLGRPLPIEAPVDAILSTATFHWVPDHDALFRNLAAVIRPGGRLVAQCGGIGNIERVRRIARSVGDGFDASRNFATPLATAARLEAAGFGRVEVWLTDAPTRLGRGEPLETYLATVCLREHIARLPPGDRAAYVSEVARRMPEPVLDYVRLNILAVRRG
ncbi:MAG: methyltransferase domain-containing protein [Chloroflexi bacterium]|nr:methyltransferase domain-containing protein [Chloroflexota bacterium]